MLRVGSQGNTSLTLLGENAYTGPDGPLTRAEGETPWPVPGGLVFDDQGGALATWHRRHTACEGDPGARECSSTTLETQVARLSDGNIVRHTLPVQPAQGGNYVSIDLVGDNGTAFVRDSSTVSAVDVASWGTKWTMATTAMPVAALALQASDGVLSTVDANGLVVGSAPLPLGAMQPALGLWTGLSSTGQLVTHVNAPLNESAFSYASVRGNRSGSRAPTPGSFEREDCAAVSMLDYIFPFSVAAERELGGPICRDTAGERPYRWGRVKFGTADGVELDSTVQECQLGPIQRSDRPAESLVSLSNVAAPAPHARPESHDVSYMDGPGWYVEGHQGGRYHAITLHGLTYRQAGRGFYLAAGLPVPFFLQER